MRTYELQKILDNLPELAELNLVLVPSLGLASYNAGYGAVQKYGGVPPYRETQNYVRTIMQAMKG